MTKILELIVDLSTEGDKLEPSTREAFQDLLDSFQASVRNLLHPEQVEPLDADDSSDEDIAQADREGKEHDQRLEDHYNETH